MTGESPPPPPTAVLAAAKPVTTGEQPGGATAGSGCGGSTSPSHLVVLSHGLSGTAADLTYLKQSLERAGGADILVHSARCNEGKTKDGVAAGGGRLAKEILELVGSTPTLSRISFVGNSLGGLYVRYAAKVLYENGDAGGPAEGATIAGLKPSVFMTIACPHLGVRRFTYVPLPSVLHPLARVLIGKTGADLFLSRKSAGVTAGGGGSNIVDNNGAGDGAAVTAPNGRESALVYRMGTSEEFLRPLRAFRRRRAYANRHGDFMVPYGTAAFVEPNEGDGAEAAVSKGGGGGDVAAPGLQVSAGADAGTGGEVTASAASAPAVGTESFTIADRLLGAKNGAIVGFSRVGPAAPGPTKVEIGEQGTGGSASREAAAGSDDSKGRRRSMEEEMAAGLNSCGWDKVSVDFGSLAPFSHNKICALSRTRITTALYGSGKSVVDHAADFLVAQDVRGTDDGADVHDGSMAKDTDVALRGQYWLTRVVFLRCLGFVYAAAFLSGLRDNGALFGEDGLLPATRYMARVQQHLAHLTPWEKALRIPTVFWVVPPTAANLWWVAAVGAGISCFVVVRGAANLPAMFLLWALYHSLVNVGQTWYSFGWESQLLETGFLAMFLVPWLSLSRLPKGSPPSLVCVWGYRWLLFRIMLGAGLIKMRGDQCWRDLTCMDYHYQTQPNPNPLSLYLHLLPSAGWHKMEVVVNHVVELVLPWCLLLTRRPRCFAGWVQILFQVALVASGNLSFLNWLTAVPAVFSFDDLHLAGLFRPRVVGRLVRHVADTSSSGGGGGGGGGARGTQVEAKVPAPAVEQRGQGAGVAEESQEKEQSGGKEGDAGQENSGDDGEDNTGKLEKRRQEARVDEESEEEGAGGGDDGENNSGSGSAEGGPSSVPGPSSGSTHPPLARAESSLQWSSESEDDDDEASGATNYGDQTNPPAGDCGDGDGDGGGGGGGGGGSDDGSGESVPCVVATPVLDDDGCSSSNTSSSSSCGRPRESFGLRFRGQGTGQGETKTPPTSSPSTAEDPPARVQTDGGGAATSASAGDAGRTDCVARKEEERCASGDADDKTRPPRGGALHGARRALRWAADGLLLVLVVKGSVPVVKNMAGVGGGQTMNRNFDSLRIVNTYGNFGSVTKARGEVILKGTTHSDPLDPEAEWREYEFRCKPGDLNQRPCVISPLHYRLDWQMWFAAFQNYGNNPWLVNLVAKLLSEEDETRALVGSLIRHDPFTFPETAESGDGVDESAGVGGPPVYIKADLYLYEFAAPTWWSSNGTNGDGSSTDGGRERGAWWTRRFVREYLPPVDLGNPSLRQFLASHGLG
eukprot:g17873.t1